MGIANWADHCSKCRAMRQAATSRGRAGLDPNPAAEAAGIDAPSLNDAAVDGRLQLAGFRGPDALVTLQTRGGHQRPLRGFARAAGGGAYQGRFGWSIRSAAMTARN